MQLIIKGDTELYRRLDSLDDVLKRTFWLAVRDDYEDNLMRNIKPHFQTGRLERNAYVKPIDNGVEGGIKDNGMMVNWKGKKYNYAYFVHEGTRSHLIEPNKKKALRWESGGKFVFAKKVQHPGYKGDPFLKNAAQKTFKRLNEIFTNELKSKGVI